MAPNNPHPTLQTIPAELRLQILSYLLPSSSEIPNHALEPAGLGLDDLRLSPSYQASETAVLNYLLVCRQFAIEFTAQAYRSANFVIRSTYAPPSLPDRLSVLSQIQISSLRHISIVVSGTLFFQEEVLNGWRSHVFNNPDLRLDTLSFILARHWQPISVRDFMPALVSWLVGLDRQTAPKKIRFVYNDATDLGTFIGWYVELLHRLLGEDHRLRFVMAKGVTGTEDALGGMRTRPKECATGEIAKQGGEINSTGTGWACCFNDGDQSIVFVATEPHEVMTEEEWQDEADRLKMRPPRDTGRPLVWNI
jgi:hypothetical protein